ncbi:S-layer homology domain-containing protein [Paenibacillus nasutitermitis]|uniref:SLH domain-containing protein n=1 Tax=Paenibacillus nasutitermitis TaxID=1652958 RepID=A0A917E0F7_9BACL|nr:S-layer homology domain-containing protein [Paenibacillus nasutitermitis]GGD91031.1 hypothetical protein GCM10010911_57160 [Paenibacillus nasutitermitis]
MKKKWLGLLLTLVLVFTLLPAYAFADNYNLVVSVNNNQVILTGGNASYGGKNLTLRVADNSNTNILADQNKADANGNYSFGPYTLEAGNYTAYVGGVGNPESKTFTVSQSPVGNTNANLKSLQLSGIPFDFSADKTDYPISVGNAVSSVTVTASAADPQAIIKINNETAATKQVNVNEGVTQVSVEVTAQDGITKKTYSLSITRPAVQTVVSNVPIQVSTEPLSLSIPEGTTNATLQVTSDVAGTTRTATLPLIEVKAVTSLGNVSLSIPAGTKITAPANWDGVIKLPTLLSNSSVWPDSGDVSAVIEVGSEDVTLTFDKAVRLLLPYQAGKAAGYAKGNVFTPITKALSTDTQTAADTEIQAGGDAKIDVGNDQVIWTKHFTKFASYTPASNGGYYGNIGGNASNVISTNGGTVDQNGVKIVIPAGAVASDIKVTVDKVTDVSKLPVDPSQKLVSDVFEIKKDNADNFSAAVSITLPFNKTLVDPAQTSVGIYWFNEQTNKWIALDNTQVDKTNFTATGSVNHFGKFAVLADVKKEDIPTTKPNSVELSDIKGHWAETNIQALIQLEAITGYPDGTFKPSKSITRAEFVSVLVKAFDLPAKDGKTFTDITDHWAKSFIATAAAHGIISGYSDTAFGPNNLITREQMAQMIVSASNIELVSSGKTYKDSADISGWAKAAVLTAVSKELIGGYEDGTLKPKGNATRAEAVTIILRALNLNK